MKKAKKKFLSLAFWVQDAIRAARCHSITLWSLSFGAWGDFVHWACWAASPSFARDHFQLFVQHGGSDQWRFSPLLTHEEAWATLYRAHGGLRHQLRTPASDCSRPFECFLRRDWHHTNVFAQFALTLWLTRPLKLASKLSPKNRQILRCKCVRLLLHNTCRCGTLPYGIPGSEFGNWPLQSNPRGLGARDLERCIFKESGEEIVDNRCGVGSCL
ncbi:hypothetical protein D8B26_008413 [Coccidioides posadasii str. Silveira]|uniref:Uncharacterized protein n=1 Tax=Coccidioides posadasii (strain RMSCC 757 / Silveira) TaxID=443226 RepID=E9D852_COCPS|nr:hypothetical protein CPSG_06004 [Coccidioides posadasii str. Silveira]QVM05555.1 hypothetical protein D8B26_008413 [Coccidioides posadasii str. Silveira]